MANVVQIDLWQVSLLGQLLEPAHDRVGMRRRAVLTAEQPPAIVVVRPEVAALLVKATALRAAAPTAHAPGVRPCRADPSRHGRQAGLSASSWVRCCRNRPRVMRTRAVLGRTRPSRLRPRCRDTHRGTREPGRKRSRQPRVGMAGWRCRRTRARQRLKPPLQPLILAVPKSRSRTPDVGVGVVAALIKAMHNGIPALVARPVVSAWEIVL